MIIYFAKAEPTDDIDSSTLFEYNGQYYYYQLELNEDSGEFTIYDTCNRIMPFDAGQISSLLKTVSFTCEYLVAVKENETDLHDRIQELEDYYEMTT